jgi:membrane protein YqaA with SNARE-associated domain
LSPYTARYGSRRESQAEEGDGHVLVVPASSAPQRGWRRLLRLMNVLYGWAESGWSRTAVLGWGVVQGSVMPGPADGLVIPLTIADPRRAYSLATFATVGSIIGGIGAWYIGSHLFAEVGVTVLGWVGMTEPRLELTRALVDRYGWMIIAFSAIAPISTKTVCITAGVLAMPFPEFVTGIAVGRVTRYFAIATILKFAGERLRVWLTRRAENSRSEVSLDDQASPGRA